MAAAAGGASSGGGGGGDMPDIASASISAHDTNANTTTASSSVGASETPTTASTTVAPQNLPPSGGGSAGGVDIALLDEKTTNKLIKKELKVLAVLLESLPSHVERERVLNRRHALLTLELRRLERGLPKYKTAVDLAQRERDQAKLELERNILDKDEIERLCRELQKQNKTMKDNCQRLKEENELKRKEMEDRFQSSMGELTDKLGEDEKNRSRRLKESEDLGSKFEAFMDQFRLRQEHIDKLLRHKDLEIQLAEAKVAQQARIAQATDQQLSFYKQRSTQLTHSEKELKAQLQSYKDKHGQFEETLSKSSSFLATYRTEKDAMLAKIEQKQQENQGLKAQCERAAGGMAGLVREKATQLEALQGLNGKIGKMEQLCKALQLQRDDLRSTLSSRNPTHSLLVETATIPKELLS